MPSPVNAEHFVVHVSCYKFYNYSLLRKGDIFFLNSIEEVTFLLGEFYLLLS
jgi:hypothetical protein